MSEMNGKRVFITGGTGSFGQALTSRLMKEDCQVVIFSRDEKKQEDMRHAFTDDRLSFVIGDVRDSRALARAMRGANLVFHAAALKQVPSCEFYPTEAVRTNILGTENALEAGEAAGVDRIVVLSTDKAVYPINAMGMSKALAEQVARAYARGRYRKDYTVCITRYGNVMGSRGSVIPLFWKQLREGMAPTVTDPRMTRFIMTLDDSVDLVLHALLHGESGDLFVQKSPASTVADLVKAQISLSGVDVEPQIIGVRHGEKTHETLVSREEMAKAVDMGRYLRVPADRRSLNYSTIAGEPDIAITSTADYTSEGTKQLSVDDIIEILHRADLVPDWVLQRLDGRAS